MSRITLEEWLRLVERHTGLSQTTALRRSRIYAVKAALDNADLTDHDESAEAQATAAAQLARAIFELRPLRRWPGRPQGMLAAATAAELLRTAGWSIPTAQLNRFGREIERGESAAYIARRLLAERIVSSPPALDAEVYLSVPVSSSTARQRSLAASWGLAIEEELETLQASTGLRLFLRAPGLRSREPTEVRTVVRTGLHRSVLHVVIGVGGGTPGIGIEIQASIRRRRPVVWLVPHGDEAPQSVQVASIEADVEIVGVATEQDLRAIIRQQVITQLPTMRRLLHEKNTIPVAIVELQEEMKRRWMQLDNQAGGLAEIRIRPERAVLLLTEPFVLYNEANLSELDALASLLDIDIFTARKTKAGGVRLAG